MSYGESFTIRTSYSHMVKEKVINGNVVSRRFETMFPIDVIAEFTNFAKHNAGTGLGKFDYGVALRILLERNNYYEVVSCLEEDILDLQSQIHEIKKQLNNKSDNVDEGNETNRRDKSSGVKTFGK